MNGLRIEGLATNGIRGWGMFPVSTAIIIILGLGFFAYTCYIRLKPLLKAPKAGRADQIGGRIIGVFEFAFGQERLLFKDFWSGVFHALIFWGFCVVAIRSIELFGMGLDAHFIVPGFSGVVGDVYNLVKDIFVGLVMIGVVALLVRRIVFRPKRLTLSLEANAILLTIFVLMLSDLLIEGSEFVMQRTADIPAYAPLATLTAAILAGWNLSYSTLEVIFNISYFVHIVGIILFLNYLPYGKHFHILTSLPNVFFRNLKPYGEIVSMNLEDESATTFGIDKIEQFDRKALLDMYTCTECGRCQDQCPAFACDKPLSPKEFTIALRDHLYSKTHVHPVGVQGGGDGGPALLGDVVKKEAVWACTTCRACEEACPLLIEYVQKMIDLRRHMVLMQGELSAEAQTALKNIETNSNPWGIGFSERGNWAKGLGIKTMAEDSNAEYLYFVGCAGSFDDRAKKVSKAFAELLQKAGVSFAILGEEEACTGDSARRLGNEYLFQMLAKQNIETFKRYNVKKIITTCPHCYNTIKNEYPQFGGNYEVLHHSELLKDLVKSGRLNLQATGNRQPATFHDSCYLGRYNNIYSAPREVMKDAGLKTIEMKQTKEQGRCCGAGGGWMWMEDTEGTRINHKRLEDIEATGATAIGTACPFCLTMLSDATKEKDVEAKYQVKDIAEFLLESVQ